jgi:hypothetical protein
MNGRYRISMPSVLESGARCRALLNRRTQTAHRWHLIVQTCRSLAADGLDYAVSFVLTGEAPNILITASEAVQCAVRAQEAAWFLPQNIEIRNAGTAHWRSRMGAICRTELLSGQRENFKPGRTNDTANLDDAVAA